MPMKMKANAPTGCTMYVSADACGRKRITEYAYCGGKHRDTRSENEKCYRKRSVKRGGKGIVIAMGCDHHGERLLLQGVQGARHRMEVL